MISLPSSLPSSSRGAFACANIFILVNVGGQVLRLAGDLAIFNFIVGSFDKTQFIDARRWSKTR